jgi:hypothetical protein
MGAFFSLGGTDLEKEKKRSPSSYAEADQCSAGQSSY